VPWVKFLLGKATCYDWGWFFFHQNADDLGDGKKLHKNHMNTT